MKVRLEVSLSGSDGERSLVRSVEMPAPPTAGLRVLGSGWNIEVAQVSFTPDTGEYRASCRAVSSESTPLADLVRIFEMDGWRATAAK
jgi:hypothetical protein